MVMHLMRQFGAPAWIVEAKEFPHFLDMAYKSHFGEIWLYNNDLQVVGSAIGDTFRSLYLALVCGTLSDNIDAVKILVREDCEDQVFSGAEPPFTIKANSPIVGNLQQVLNLGCKQRLETFYFGKMSLLKGKSPPILRALHDSWVFYTHKGCLDKNAGIVMVRPNSFPFCVADKSEESAEECEEVADKGTGDTRGGEVMVHDGNAASEGGGHFAMVWQLREETRLQQRLKLAFEECFTNPKNFLRLDMDAEHPLTSHFLPGWSPRTEKLMAKRLPQVCDGLSLGDSVDVAILASQYMEISPLERLLTKGTRGRRSELMRTPFEADPYEYLLYPKGGARKILLAVIGEDNLASATRTWDIIEKWNPRHVILLGVAGGDPTDDSVNIGDVVVGEVVVGYEHGQMTDAGFRPYPTIWTADHFLAVAAARLMENWYSAEIDDRPDHLGDEPLPQCRLSPVASGSKLVASGRFFAKDLKGLVMDKITATEMEGDGVGYACDNHPRGKRKMLLVKSIMDRSTEESRVPDGEATDQPGGPKSAQQKREERNQRRKQRRAAKKYACNVAAQFVYDLLAELWPIRAATTDIAYFLPCKPGSVYVHVTDQCYNNCLFCIKRSGPRFFGYDLPLGGESPKPSEIIAAMESLPHWKAVGEVVFCGMGEPLLRYDCVVEVCKRLRESRGAKVKTRVDTSGLFWATDPRLHVLNWIDVLSISLNAENAEKYDAICRPTIPNAFATLMQFLEATKQVEMECRQAGQTFPEVRLSVVNTTEEDFIPDSGRRAYERGTFPVPDRDECKKIADRFGWKFVVKNLFRDSQDPKWDDRSFQKLCARGIELDSCRECPHRH